MIQFKEFQKQDYARLALHDGGILGHDKGLGKGIAVFAWSLLKVGFPPVAPLRPKEPCLIVAPSDCHQQVTDEGREKFGITPIPLMTVDDLDGLSTMNPLTGRLELPPGFYLTSYTALTTNGVAAFPELSALSREAWIEFLHLTRADFAEFYESRTSIYSKHYTGLGLDGSETWMDAMECYRRKRRADPTNAGRKALDEAWDILQHLQPASRQFATPQLSDLSPNQLQWLQWEVVQRVRRDACAGIGETRELKASGVSGQESTATPHRIKCVYSPALVDRCSESFAAVAVDEGVKMKGDDTIIGQGLRQMNPRYRLVLSGTPIKNRLPDIFWLAQWAAGGHTDPTPRWPYLGSAREREAFASEFLLAERNLTREKNSETKRRYVKLSPQVCNIHRLWKLFGPILLRRLKKDIGEDIVKKHRHVVRVPMGTRQAATYRYHLEAEYLDCNRKKAVGAQLQALRTVAAAPHCGQLQRRPLPDGVGTRSTASVDPSDFISGETYIPKYAAALNLVRDAMLRGEQIVLFSDLIEPLHALAARLREAGVPHLVATGDLSPARRRKLSADFKQGPPQDQPPHSRLPVSQLYPVLLASNCMAEGHSWPRCNNIAQLAYSWAFDKLSQGIDRCHRLNSVRDLNYYALLCDGTTDRILENNLTEKGNTSDLVLDGQLMDENPEEISLGELLRSAQAEFGATTTLDERELEQEWPELREQLRSTYRQWVGTRSTASVDSVSTPIPVPRQLSTPIPLNPSMHPWKERHLRRVNLRQRSLAFA